MRILIDGIMYSLKQSGGVRRYFDGFLPWLNKIDRDVEVQLFLHQGVKGKLSFSKKIEVSRINQIPTPLPKTITKPFIDPINARILKGHWRQSIGDIFHSTYYTRHPDPGIDQVVTVYDMNHEIFPQYFLGRKHDMFRLRKRAVVESAEAVICISKNTKKDLLRFYDLDKNKVHVIHLGKDKIFRKISNQKTKARFKKKYQIKKPFIFHLGPRGRNKNFSSLVKAFALWKRRGDFEIITVGGGKFSQKEKLYLKKLGIVHKIHNFGYVSDQDLVLFYNCCHAFVFPSLYEGFGIPLLEAMACGALVLASNTSSFPEVGKDCILYFNPNNPGDICRALDQSLIKRKRLKLIDNGFKRAKKFSWEKTARQTLKVYQSLK